MAADQIIMLVVLVLFAVGGFILISFSNKKNEKK